jgi:uncharacterized protein DUF2510
VSGPGPAVPAGWYPDSAVPGQQRYWDGQQWTGYVAPLAVAPGPTTPGAAAVVAARPSPPGWYPDPSGGSDQRRWDGSAWTDETRRAPLLDVSAPRYLRGTRVHILVTEHGVSVDDKTMAWDKAEHLYYSIVEHTSSRRGFYGKEYNFEVWSSADRLRISIGFQRDFSDGQCHEVFDALLDASSRFLEPRLVSALIARVDEGETIEMGKIGVSREGASHHGKRVSWADLERVRIVPFGALEVYARGGDKVFHAGGGPDIMLLPTLFATCASRYGQTP